MATERGEMRTYIRNIIKLSRAKLEQVQRQINWRESVNLDVTGYGYTIARPQQRLIKRKEALERKIKYYEEMHENE